MSAIENIVISMENATERRKHITKQFESKKLSFSFFNAYTYQSNSILHNIEESRILTKGEKGCLMI
ncbi:glycosyltransferase family 25 protein [Haemophilus haemolyticus]|uniref:glycosyltransferase family 25 protein n=1 Tax=Haemophilus haemolyticus TaxID=726 RepID=UPI000E56DC3A|nr:glycosyltransferase family 25 protein [Haemophilus haemolyticus]